MGSIARAAVNKRDLILHDSLAFLSLIVVSFALFGVTLFLFQSFESHREELGKEWSARGRVALEQGRPEEAVAALRTALTYEPDVRADQLLLADALARAGHTDEATNYFLNLWDVRPGDGFINLQLARLAAKKGDYPEAVDYYRASTFGSWEGDGVGRRRAVRLELVDLLIGQKQFPQAKDELVTVSGNAPTGSPVNLLVARKFEQMGDTSDALVYDEKALASQALNPEALQQAASLAYSLGEYSQAERLLQRAVESKPKPKNEAELTELLEKSRRIRELNLSRDQDAEVRAEHILTASVIAQERLKGCAGQSSGAGTAGYGGGGCGIPGGGGVEGVERCLECGDCGWARTPEECARECGDAGYVDGFDL